MSARMRAIIAMRKFFIKNKSWLGTGVIRRSLDSQLDCIWILG